MEADTYRYLEDLTTEQPNPNSFGIDTKSTEEIVKIINEEDSKVPQAIRSELKNISRVIDIVVSQIKQGGRLVYVGAGTSGRIGILDAAECPPTYGTPPEMIQGIIAGGPPALLRSVEGAEDNELEGKRAIDDLSISMKDVVIGITASGHAPFVNSAIKEAKKKGAIVVTLSCNPNSKTYQHSDHRLFIDVGPEIITGSTRMKSGTAQKLVLNMITTTAMIKLGKVYNNLMVDLIPVNKKLESRSKRLVQLATGCDLKTASKAFEDSERRPKIAIVMILLGVTRDEAKQLLEENDGRIGLALQAYHSRK